MKKTLGDGILDTILGFWIMVVTMLSFTLLLEAAENDLSLIVFLASGIFISVSLMTRAVFSIISKRESEKNAS